MLARKESGSKVRKKRVLLVGDVGRRRDGFYHVGDEATLYQNYSLYCRAGDFDLTLLSWALTHDYMELSEHEFWEMPTGQEGWQRVVGIVEQAKRWKHLPFLKYSPESRICFELIRDQDLIHILGGGNLNSIFPVQLYSRALIMLLAKVLGKPVLVTGQTIGPLDSPTDREAARCALNAVEVITVRDSGVSPSLIKELGISHPQLHIGLDDAYFIEGSPSSALDPFWLSRTPGRMPLRVGVSVHLNDDTVPLRQVLAHALNELALSTPIEVYFIPHIVMSQDTRRDVPFMRDISTRLSTDIPQRAITCQDLMKHPEPAKERLVKSLTAAMDVVVATRYHALVFALSSGVPVLALNSGEYYNGKNLGLLEMVFEDRAGDYALDLSREFSVELDHKLGWVIEGRERIHQTLMAKRRSWSERSDNNLKLAQELLRANSRRQNKR